MTAKIEIYLYLFLIRYVGFKTVIVALCVIIIIVKRTIDLYGGLKCTFLDANRKILTQFLRKGKHFKLGVVNIKNSENFGFMFIRKK